MVQFIIVHNKHEGCYDYSCYEDEANRVRLTSITINPPKIFLFNDREQAQDFFDEYINDVDVTDSRCIKGDNIEHIEYCTCGVIEVDNEQNPILFYNKKNQIFLLEHGPETFVSNQELKNDMKNFNLTNRLLKNYKTLSAEQRKRCIELGKYCEDLENNKKKRNAIEQENKINNNVDYFNENIKFGENNIKNDNNNKNEKIIENSENIEKSEILGENIIKSSKNSKSQKSSKTTKSKKETQIKAKKTKKDDSDIEYDT